MGTPQRVLDAHEGCVEDTYSQRKPVSLVIPGRSRAGSYTASFIGMIADGPGSALHVPVSRRHITVVNDLTNGGYGISHHSLPPNILVFLRDFVMVFTVHGTADPL